MYFGTESIFSLAPKIWEIVPCEIKNARSLDTLKKETKNSGQQINVLGDFAKDTQAI